MRLKMKYFWMHILYLLCWKIFLLSQVWAFHINTENVILTHQTKHALFIPSTVQMSIKMKEKKSMPALMFPSSDVLLIVKMPTDVQKFRWSLIICHFDETERSQCKLIRASSDINPPSERKTNSTLKSTNFLSSIILFIDFGKCVALTQMHFNQIINLDFACGKKDLWAL